MRTSIPAIPGLLESLGLSGQRGGTAGRETGEDHQIPLAKMASFGKISVKVLY